MADQLFYLCGRGASHFWQQLFWLVDIAENFRKYHHIDWHPVLKSAHRQNTDRILGQGVIFTHFFINSPLPEPVRASTQRDPAVLKLEKRPSSTFKCLPEILLRWLDLAPIFITV
jgi:hypothetical protein